MILKKCIDQGFSHATSTFRSTYNLFSVSPIVSFGL